MQTVTHACRRVCELAFSDGPAYTGRACSSSMTTLSTASKADSCKPCSAMMMLMCSWLATVLKLCSRCAAELACWGWLSWLRGWSRMRRAGQVTSLVATATSLRSEAAKAPAKVDLVCVAPCWWKLANDLGNQSMVDFESWACTLGRHKC